jgi:hypothetical protein
VALFRDVIKVRVSKRVLWVDADAYPLHNIASARRVETKRRWWKAIEQFLKQAVPLAIAFAVLGVVPHDGRYRDGIALVQAGLAVAFLAVLGLLLRRLLRRKVYALVIDTSGASSTPLFSRDEDVIIDLIERITDAINNPEAEFQVLVDQRHIGDRITQYGDHNTGKKATA